MTGSGFDNALDAIFKSSAGTSVVKPPPTVIPAPSLPPSVKAKTTKRKHEKQVVFADEAGTKRQKQGEHELRAKAEGKKSRPQPRADPSDEDEDEDEDPTVEDSYHQRRKNRPVAQPSNDDQAPKSKTEMPDSDSSSASAFESESESDLDAPPPVHETLSQSATSLQKGKKKYVPDNESSGQKDARTIYIGNLPASAAKSAARKQLQKHVLRSLVAAYPDLPKPQVESSRFRSVAFKAPTSKLPSDALSSSSKPGAPNKPKTDSSSSERDRARAAEWRAAHDPEGGYKTFQTPAQKKKTAYITGALHDGAMSSASAYVVFAYAPPGDGTPAWDPVEVAARAVVACNGTTFMDRVLRVDRVGKTKSAAGAGEERGIEKGDPRTMVFVGGLDFEANEDAVRALFEGLLEKERGKAGEEKGEESEAEGSQEEEESSAGSSEDEGEEESDSDDDGKKAIDTKPKSTKPPVPVAAAKSWVKSVRIVRDKDTQLGKGFAYVHFIDRASADEILAMEPGTIKLAKRKLRVQRCKTLPGALSKVKVPKSDSQVVPKGGQKSDNKDSPKKGDRQDSTRQPRTPSQQERSSKRPTRIDVPRADPALGERIRSLSKTERKSVKASDADRVARRLAKKKAKVQMDKGARRETARSKAGILGGKANKSKGHKVKPKAGKRERSDKAIMKKNTKK